MLELAINWSKLFRDLFLLQWHVMLSFDSSLTVLISVQIVEMAVSQCPLGAPPQLPNSAASARTVSCKLGNLSRLFRRSAKSFCRCQPLMLSGSVIAVPVQPLALGCSVAMDSTRLSCAKLSVLRSALRSSMNEPTWSLTPPLHGMPSTDAFSPATLGTNIIILLSHDTPATANFALMLYGIHPVRGPDIARCYRASTWAEEGFQE